MLGEGKGCLHIAELQRLRFDPQQDSENLKDGLRCYYCENGTYELCVCLHADCLRVLCAPKHSLQHFQETTHCLRIDLGSQRVACLLCNNEDALLNLEASSDFDESDSSSQVEPKGLTGLQNIGNTCYMNAALQALSNCPPLVQHFLSRRPPPPPPHHHQHHHHHHHHQQQGQTPALTASFHRLIADMWSRHRPSYVAPAGILYGIRSCHPMFRGFHQHDTQEFLRCLMDQLHEEMKVPDLEPPIDFMYDWSGKWCETEQQEGGGASSQSEGEEYETCDSGVSERSSLSDENTQHCHQRDLSRSPSPSQALHRHKHISQHGSPSRRKHLSYRSIISDVFDGKLISSVQCLTCNRVSTRVETFQDLSLPIPNRDHLTMLHQGSVNTSPAKCTHLHLTDQQGWLAWFWEWVCSWFWGPTVGLHDCLAAFFSADELKGDNMYSCEKCNKLRNGVKYSRVLQCPEVLCIHLKRFRHELMFSSKIGNYVTFPLEGLDLSPYLHNNCPSQVTTYDLTSVICHHGAAGGGGHYTCYALNAASRRWYEFDDQTVRRVTPETVANCEAYVLFYRKDGSKVNRWRLRAGRLQELSSGDTERYAISRDWLDRFNTFAEPGPIDNKRLLCPHGALAPESSSVFVGQPLWSYLHSKFGGGPALKVSEVSACDQCSDQSGEYSLLRVQLNEFQRLQACSGPSYCITMKWLTEWEAYVTGASTTPPGPIDNSPIALSSEDCKVCEVSSGQWELLHKLYKGGPPILSGHNTPVPGGAGGSGDHLVTSDNLDSGCWVPNNAQAKRSTSDLIQIQSQDIPIEVSETF